MSDAEALEGMLGPGTALMLPGAFGVIARAVPFAGEGMAGFAWFEGSISAGSGAISTGCAGA